MKSPTPPAPPDPVKTAEAQTTSNVKTATNQQQLNMVNQTNPYGSQTYQQNGTWENGTPKFSMTTTLSPQEKAKQDQQWKFDSLVNDLGIKQTEKIAGLLDKPIDFGAPLDFGDPLKLDNEAVEGRLFDLGRKRLDPMLTQRREGLENQLRNQGLAPGTEAWDREMSRNTRGENDAYDQLLLSGRGQSVQELMGERGLRNQEMLQERNLRNQEMLTGRNQPINETTALMRGGQVSQPQFGSTPQTNVAGTDVAGLTMDAYKYGPLAQYQAEQANKQAMLGGLFGLGGAALGGWGKDGFKKPGFMS